MAQRGDDPPGEHELVAAGEGRHEVAGDEQDQQPQQGVLAVHPPEAGGEDDATDGHGERVSGDEVAGDGLGDSEVGGDLREKAMMTNSVNPMPKPPRASARSAMGMTIP